MERTTYEVKTVSDYIDRQPFIAAYMRTIVINWLFQVAKDYEMNSQTLHIAVNLFDRYLAHKTVDKESLQLVGTASLFIAMKFEEVHIRTASDMLYATANSYTLQQLVDMELHILYTLNFDVSSWKTSLCCADEILDENESSSTHIQLTHLMVDVVIMDYEMTVNYDARKLAMIAFEIAKSLLFSTNEEKSTYVQDKYDFCHYEFVYVLRNCVKGDLHGVFEKHDIDVKRLNEMSQFQVDQTRVSIEWSPVRIYTDDSCVTS
ncbi:cyclin-A2-like [Glandiceps talaboti]